MMKLHKEIKVVIWVGVLVIILSLYVLVEGNKEDALQFIDFLLYGYVFFAALSIIDGVYKWIKNIIKT